MVYILILIASLFLYCNNVECGIIEHKIHIEQNKANNKDSISFISNELKLLYDKRNISSNNVKEFFNLFPNTFENFLQIYGYDYIKGASPLYDFYEEHIMFIFSITAISEQEKIQKFVNIGIDGKWEADAVSLLRDCLLNLMLKNIDYSIDIVNAQPAEKAKRLWYFLFDGSHPSDKEVRKTFEELYDLVRKRDIKQAELLKGAYQKVLKNEETHGK